jgi:prephenate dehydratase
MGVAKLKVAIQGELGAFSHEAALRALGEAVEVVPRPSFEALFASVVDGEADRAIVPIENSLAGSIHENYDRLKSGPLHIVGETELRIRQCLIGRPGATLDSLRRVASHPVALAQCRRFFAEHPQIEPVTAYDTAGSVQDLLKTGRIESGAIASRLAAELYGGLLLLEGIEDDPQNYTRFLVLAREPGPAAEASKTSLVFVLENVPGALHRAVGAFASRGADLCKIESRPLPGLPWEYALYLDVLGDPRGAAGEAIEELRTMARELRVLGSYPEGVRKALRDG